MSGFGLSVADGFREQLAQLQGFRALGLGFRV